MNAILYVLKEIKKMNKKICNSWDDILKDEFNSSYFKALEEIIDSEYKNKICFPPKEDIFCAFKTLPIENIKVVILGQDPYHELNQAMGLAFSVPNGVAIPPSLRNIYKEMIDDGVIDEMPISGDLFKLSKDGVFLLNTTLTVREGEALSHFNLGWETFTDNVISYINMRNDPICFILWGSNARSKKKLITNKNHLVLESNHPSPLSAYRGFFGSHPFSKANDFLIKNGRDGVNWRVLNES